MVFSISKPFRRPLYTNLWLTVSLIILFGLNTYQVVSGDSFITNLLNLMPDVSQDFRMWTLVIVAGNTLLTYLYERIIVWYVSIWQMGRVEKRVRAE